MALKTALTEQHLFRPFFLTTPKLLIKNLKIFIKIEGILLEYYYRSCNEMNHIHETVDHYPPFLKTIANRY